MLQIDETKLEYISRNVKSTVIGNKLVVVIDLSVSIGLSSTGKMEGIGSTSGFALVPSTDAKMNLYIGKRV